MESIYFFHYECIVMELKSYVKYCSELFATELKLCSAFPVWIFFLNESDPLLSCNYFEVYEARIVGVYNSLFTSITIVLEDENTILIYKLFFRTLYF